MFVNHMWYYASHCMSKLGEGGVNGQSLTPHLSNDASKVSPWRWWNCWLYLYLLYKISFLSVIIIWVNHFADPLVNAISIDIVIHPINIILIHLRHGASLLPLIGKNEWWIDILAIKKENHLLTNAIVKAMARPILRVTTLLTTTATISVPWLIECSSESMSHWTKLLTLYIENWSNSEF